MWSHYLIPSMITVASLTIQAPAETLPAGQTLGTLPDSPRQDGNLVYVCLETQSSINAYVCIPFVLRLEKEKWLWNGTKESTQGGSVWEADLHGR